MTVSRISDQITLVTEEVSEATTTPQKLVTFVMDGDAYPLDPCPCFTGRVKQVGGGEGYIRVYDLTNTQELLLKSITSDAYVIIKEALADYILSGQAVIQVFIYTNGTGEIFMDCGSLCMCWVS